MSICKFILTSSCLFGALSFQSCTGCGQEDDLPTKKIERQDTPLPTKTVTVDNNEASVVHMVKDGGVYKVPVRINGVEMDFIFDTGASTISISNLEASYLMKQGKIRREDVEGSSQFVDAVGNVSNGTILNLRDVSIGGRSAHNVRANVVNNSEAPLLLGQSFLEQFGRIAIDYSEGTITFY